MAPYPPPQHTHTPSFSSINHRAFLRPLPPILPPESVALICEGFVSLGAAAPSDEGGWQELQDACLLSDKSCPLACWELSSFYGSGALVRARHGAPLPALCRRSVVVFRFFRVDPIRPWWSRAGGKDGEEVCVCVREERIAFMFPIFLCSQQFDRLARQTSSAKC